MEHFAPLATCRETESLDDPVLLQKIQPFRDRSIELLIATDVLSEGQNLQDAQYLINYDLHWNPVRMIQRAGRIDRLFSPHDKVYIYNVMPEQGLEDLLKLVASLTRKLETIEDAVALDASVLGEQIEAKQLDKIMALRRGGADADRVYMDGERNQGMDVGLEILNQYLDIMKRYATKDVLEIPDGVYSIKKGTESGIYVMLRMPEELSGEVYWRFYPLGEVSRPMISANEVLKIVQTNQDELRLELSEDQNPFQYLQQPLQAAVNQIGEAYLEVVAVQSPDKFVTKLRRLLSRDDLLKADAELWRWLNAWVNQALPPDALRRRSMEEPVRLINRMKASAGVQEVVQTLRPLKAAIEAEGLDRPVTRPESVQPSVRDLQLVAWELVVGPNRQL